MCVSSGTWSLNEQEFSACFPTKKKIKMTYAIFYFFFQDRNELMAPVALLRAPNTGLEENIARKTFGDKNWL